MGDLLLISPSDQSVSGKMGRLCRSCSLDDKMASLSLRRGEVRRGEERCEERRGDVRRGEGRGYVRRGEGRGEERGGEGRRGEV